MLIYGINIKSINTDKWSEFYDWKKFKRSINNHNDNINVYFCHSYCAWEKRSNVAKSEQILTKI